MLAALARQLERAALNAGRRAPAAYERQFQRAIAHPDMRVAIEALSRDLARAPGVEHIATARDGATLLRATTHEPQRVRLEPNVHEAGPRVSWAHNHPVDHRNDWETVLANGGLESPLSPPDILFTATFPGGYGAKGFGRAAALTSDGSMLRKSGSTAQLTSRGRDKLSKPAMKALLLAITEEAANARGRIFPYQEATNRALDRVGLMRYGARYGETNTRMLRNDAEFIRSLEDALVSKHMHPRVFGLPYPFRWSQIATGAGAVGAAGAGAALGSRNRRRRRK